MRFYPMTPTARFGYFAEAPEHMGYVAEVPEAIGYVYEAPETMGYVYEVPETMGYVYETPEVMGYGEPEAMGYVADPPPGFVEGYNVGYYAEAPEVGYVYEVPEHMGYVAEAPEFAGTGYVYEAPDYVGEMPEQMGYVYEVPDVGAYSEAPEQMGYHAEAPEQMGYGEAPQDMGYFAEEHHVTPAYIREMSREIAPPSASAEPCTSALISTGSSLAVPSRMPFSISSRVPRVMRTKVSGPQPRPEWRMEWASSQARCCGSCMVRRTCVRQAASPRSLLRARDMRYDLLLGFDPTTKKAARVRPRC